MGAQVVTWTMGQIPSEQYTPTVVTLTFLADITDRDGNGNPVWTNKVANAITNTVVLIQQDYQITDTATSTVRTVADLAVGKVCRVDEVVQGYKGILTYTITYTNYGPSYAQNVTISDMLPTGETAVWHRSSLAPQAGGIVVVSATVHAQTLEPLTNVVTITSITPDPDLSNNTDVVVITITPTVGGATMLSPYQGLRMAVLDVFRWITERLKEIERIVVPGL